MPTGTIQELADRQSRYCICIPVLNEGERIRQQLRTMKSLGPPADVIIADGSSTDGALAGDLVGEYGIRALLVMRGPGGQSA